MILRILKLLLPIFLIAFVVRLLIIHMRGGGEK
jgi:hypothetical protein